MGLASFHGLFSHASVIRLCSRRSDKFALSQLFSHNIGSIIGVAISSVNLVSFTTFCKKKSLHFADSKTISIFVPCGDVRKGLFNALLDTLRANDS